MPVFGPPVMSWLMTTRMAGSPSYPFPSIVSVLSFPPLPRSGGEGGKPGRSQRVRGSGALLDRQGGRGRLPLLELGHELGDGLVGLGVAAHLWEEPGRYRQDVGAGLDGLV